MKTQVKDFKSFVTESEKPKTRSGKLNEDAPSELDEEVLQKLRNSLPDL